MRAIPGHPTAPGSPVRVRVSAAILDHRPDDDWTNIWEWCERSRRVDHAVRTFARDVSSCLRPEGEEEPRD